MSSSKKVFLAADVFVAFVDRAHPKHIHAVAFFRYFASEHFEIYSTISVCIEAYNNINKDISPTLARDFLKAITLGNINMIYPEDAEFKLTVKALTSYGSHDLTFQEALNATLADRRRIPFICTFAYLHPLYGLTTFFLPI